jgi:hypothetical protein
MKRTEGLGDNAGGQTGRWPIQAFLWLEWGKPYNGDGRRASKVGSTLHWYGSGGEILAETDASGNLQNEYIFFGGKRVAMVPVSGSPLYLCRRPTGQLARGRAVEWHALLRRRFHALRSRAPFLGPVWQFSRPYSYPPLV